MRHLLQSLIILFSVIAVASPSFAGDDREDNKWDRDKKEQRHHNKKDNHDRHPGNPLKKIMKQLDELNDKLDELLANDVDLRGVTQNWDKKLDSTNGEADGCNSDRFTCVLDGMAVRDNETGIVWDRTPSTSVWWWRDAVRHCATREVARKGWSLPSREQLASLVDTTNSLPSLPSGHPFINIPPVGPNQYFTTTAYTEDPSQVWEVDMAEGAVGFVGKEIIGAKAWCMRGGQSFDGQDLNSLN